VIPGAIDGTLVTAIGGGVFQNKGLESVTIPDSVASIGDGAFSVNLLLTGVTIDNSVKTIGAGAFANSSLTGVTIPESVTTIGNAVFKTTH
jgi:hypothetical protein